jgi:DNA-binding NarL/FixJ family response regulator
MKRIRIGLTEDDDFFQKEFVERIEAYHPFELIYCYSNATDTLNFAEQEAPDIAIVDLGLPDMNGADLIFELKAQWPTTQFLVCSIHDQDEFVFNAIKKGATGYLLKAHTNAEFIQAILDLYNGGSPMSPEIARRVLNFIQRPAKFKILDNVLTARENEIVEFLSVGSRYKEIADKLFISIETVRKHINNIYRKLEVQSRTEAINKLRG